MNFRMMDVSELGDNCTEADLRAFQQACIARKAETGESDRDVTSWMWGVGDWQERVQQYVPLPDLS